MFQDQKFHQKFTFHKQSFHYFILTFMWEILIFKASGLPIDLKKKARRNWFYTDHNFWRLKKVKKK
jgi:hypothetical protein